MLPEHMHIHIMAKALENTFSFALFDDQRERVRVNMST